MDANSASAPGAMILLVKELLCCKKKKKKIVYFGGATETASLKEVDKIPMSRCAKESANTYTILKHVQLTNNQK